MASQITIFSDTHNCEATRFIEVSTSAALSAVENALGLVGDSGKYGIRKNSSGSYYFICSSIDEKTLTDRMEFSPSGVFSCWGRIQESDN